MAKKEPDDINPIKELSEQLVAAFDYLNANLFDGKLPRTMVMFSRNSKIIGGLFRPNSWFNEDGIACHEIIINANHMAEGDEVDLFQVLVHEMIHEWQQEFGQPGRGGYHNQQWAEKAKEVGLKPASKDNPECETGDSISTDLIKGAPAMKAIANLPEDISIPWYAVPSADDEGRPDEKKSGDPEAPPPDPEKSKAGKRTKYTCVKCGANLWGRAGLNIKCLDCSVKFVETNV